MAPWGRPLCPAAKQVPHGQGRSALPLAVSGQWPALIRVTPGRIALLCAALALAGPAHADDSATVSAPYDPVQHWEMDYESGVIWKFSSDATPLSYTILPQIITVK